MTHNHLLSRGPVPCRIRVRVLKCSTGLETLYVVPESSPRSSLVTIQSSPRGPYSVRLPCTRSLGLRASGW